VKNNSYFEKLKLKWCGPLKAYMFFFSLLYHGITKCTPPKPSRKWPEKCIKNKK